MIEIVFTDSACGALKVAQTFGKGEYRSSCISVVISHSDGTVPTQAEIDEETRKFEELERQMWERATPLGGDPGDVYGLSLGLSYGRIEDPLDLQERLSAMQTLTGCWNEDMQQEFTDMILRVRQDLQIVKNRISSGEDARIWYSDSPDELCGFHWLMDQLRELPDGHGALYAIKLPYIVDHGNGIRRYLCWGEVEPGDFHRFVQFAVRISDFVCRHYGNEWRNRQFEHAVLRASVSGKLSSVPENVYDRYIVREIEAQPGTFKEAVVVGNILGKHGLPVSDGFIHSRINILVKEGKLIAETTPNDEEPGYWRILRKPDEACTSV